jgi:5'-nucleotidase
MGVPAFAISLEGHSFQRDDFAEAGKCAVHLASLVLHHGLPTDTFLNVNVPSGTPAGFRLTRQGKRRYGEVVVEKMDPRGRKYYWIGGGEVGFQDVEGTDFHAVQAGQVSITPLHLDLTNYRSFDALASWQFDNITAFRDSDGK